MADLTLGSDQSKRKGGLGEGKKTREKRRKGLFKVAFYKSAGA